MHSFWDIADLFRLVLKELPKKNVDNTLFQMSLVCRLFWEEVLPFIWRELPSRRGIPAILEKFPLHAPLASWKPFGKVRISNGLVRNNTDVLFLVPSL